MSDQVQVCDYCGVVLTPDGEEYGSFGECFPRFVCPDCGRVWFTVLLDFEEEGAINEVS